MLDWKFVENNLEEVKKKLSARGFDYDFARLKTLADERRKVISQVETLERERNEGSREMASLKKQGDDKGFSALSEQLKTVSEKVKSLNAQRAQIEETIKTEMLGIPNIPHGSVPAGAGEGDNVEIRKRGEKPRFDFEPLTHDETGARLGILDLERAAKITGSRFALYFGAGALLERALANFMLDIHTKENGYTETLPPFAANTASLTGTGNLPKFEEDLFKLKDTDYFLIPTAEVPVTNIYRDEIIPRRRFAAEVCRIHALLPQRGGLLREGYKGDYQAASV